MQYSTDHKTREEKRMNKIVFSNQFCSHCDRNQFLYVYNKSSNKVEVSAITGLIYCVKKNMC